MKQALYAVIYDPTFPGVNRLYLNDSNQWVQGFENAETFSDIESANVARNAQIEHLNKDASPRIKDNLNQIKSRIFIKDVAADSF